LNYGSLNLNVAGDYAIRTSVSGIRQGLFIDPATRAPSTTVDVAQLSIKGIEINRTNGLMYLHVSNVFRFTSVAIATTLTDYNGGNFTMGAVQAGTMSIFDTLIYNRALTQAEYSSIFNYFNGLYGYV